MLGEKKQKENFVHAKIIDIYKYAYKKMRTKTQK